MMASADDVIRVAEGQIGYSRWNDPKPGTVYGRWFAELTGESWYGESNVPYCAMFVSWVFDQAGAKCVGLPGAYCPSMLAEAESCGRAVSVSDAQAGDVVYFDWGSDGESDHVGIVTSNRGSFLETIEGNTSDTSSGSQSNGGVVARKSRPFGTICGVVRPDYGESSHDDGKLDVDGYVGPLTVTEWQSQLGLEETGCVSGQLKECQNSYPNLAAVTFEGTGSELMLKVQEILGVPDPTGVIASGTVSMLQGWLYLNGYSCATDKAGTLGDATARALQRSLNDGKWVQ